MKKIIIALASLLSASSLLFSLSYHVERKPNKKIKKSGRKKRKGPAIRRTVGAQEKIKKSGRKKRKGPAIRRTVGAQEKRKKTVARKSKSSNASDVKKIKYFKKNHAKSNILALQKKIQQKNQDYLQLSQQEQVQLPMEALTKLLNCLNNLLEGLKNLEEKQENQIKITAPKLTLKEKRAIVRTMGKKKNLTREDGLLIEDFVYKF